MSARLRAWFRSAPLAVASSEATATDGDLVRRFADTRDDGAFAELVRRHGPMVLATCRRAAYPDVHTADDAFQATFLVLATRAATVNPPERVGAWLHGVAFHVARKAKAWARKAVSSTPADLDRIAAVEIERDADAADTRAKIDDVLAGMPSKYRAAVVLCDLEQRSRAEAAAARQVVAKARLSGRLSAEAGESCSPTGSPARGQVGGPRGGAGGVVAGVGLAAAIVPVQLTASTVRTAVLVSTGAAVGAAGGAIPASIAALAQGVPTMHSATFKLLAAGLTGIGLALGGFGLYALTAAPPAPLPNVPVAAAPLPRRRPKCPRKRAGGRSTPSHTRAAGDRSGVRPGLCRDWRQGRHPDPVGREDRQGEGETAQRHRRQRGRRSTKCRFLPDGAWLYLVTNDGESIHQCSVEKKDRLFPGVGQQGTGEIVRRDHGRQVLAPDKRQPRVTPPREPLRRESYSVHLGGRVRPQGRHRLRRGGRSRCHRHRRRRHSATAGRRARRSRSGKKSWRSSRCRQWRRARGAR